MNVSVFDHKHMLTHCKVNVLFQLGEQRLRLSALLLIAENYCLRKIAMIPSDRGIMYAILY